MSVIPINNYSDMFEDKLELIHRDAAHGVFAEHSESFFIIDLQISFFIYLHHDCTEVIECDVPSAIIKLVSDIINLNLSRISPSSPHSGQQGSIRDLATVLPVKLWKAS